MATIIGGDAPIEGGDFAEDLLGRTGDDTINAGGGDDTALGGRGDDAVNGGDGDDTVGGGVGDDILTGDAGSDLFVFGKNPGKDVITDFNPAEDMIQLRKGINGIEKPKDVLDHAKQVGDNVVIKLGDGNKIVLKNVNLDDLKDDPGSHFVIV